MPQPPQFAERLESVLQALYLLFNEGYSSTSGDDVIRRDLIEEALRLTLMLTNNPLTALPQVYALIALICFHAARLPGRVDAGGNILLLAEQDRTEWDKDLVARGLYYISRSASGELITSYHV